MDLEWPFVLCSFFFFCSNVYIDLDINSCNYSSASFQIETFYALLHCFEDLCFTWQDVNCTSLLCYNAMTCSIYIHGTLSPPPPHLFSYWEIWKNISRIYRSTDSRLCLNDFIKWILNSQASLCWEFDKVREDRGTKT